MERVTLDQLSTKANISTDLSKEGFLSRQQRLQRWTELLSREPDRPLNTFLQTEYMDAEARDSLRCADSALTVALQDPVLSDAGLTDDSYGTADRQRAVVGRRGSAGCDCGGRRTSKKTINK